MRKDDIRNWTENENEKERTVSYVRAALRRFYHHVTVEKGCDWDELVAKYSN